VFDPYELNELLDGGGAAFYVALAQIALPALLMPLVRRG
jgi:hypothetical protein